MFEFDEKTHVYKLDGKRLTGVTTILGVIAKPALIGWAANKAVDYIKDHIYDNDIDAMVTKILPEARKAHTKIKDTAADYGTHVHDQIENYCKGKKVVSINEQVDKSVQSFIDWFERQNAKVIESEKRLYSKEHWYAGTVDLVLEIDGKHWIADIKTSNGIYNTYFLQMAGYQIALEETENYDIEGHMIIQLTKTGKVRVERSYGVEKNKEAFLAALTLYRTLQDLDKQLKPTWNK